MKKTATIALVAALMLSFALVGCVRTPTPSPTPSLMPTPSPMTTPLPTTSPATTTSPLPAGSPAPTTGAGANSEAAEKIATEVDKMSEIESSHVVVIGDTALIGVQFAQQYQGELTERIKEAVSDKAKEADTAITKVVVSADADILTRIKAMVEDIKTNNGTDFANEFKEILNRISPTT